MGAILPVTHYTACFIIVMSTSLGSLDHACDLSLSIIKLVGRPTKISDDNTFVLFPQCFREPVYIVGYVHVQCMEQYCSTCICVRIHVHSSYMTLIGVHVMYG